MASPEEISHQLAHDVDSSTLESLRRHYRRRFFAAIVVLGLLAIPSLVHSQAAIQSLHNRPSNWVPDDVPVKAEFNRFADRFEVSDLLLVAWPGSNLSNDRVDRAARWLRILCPPPEIESGREDDAELMPHKDELATREDPAVVRVDQTDPSTPRDSMQWSHEDLESLSSTSVSRLEVLLADIRRAAGDETPLRWVRSGNETLDRLTASPVNLSRRAAISRLRGTLIGQSGEQTCLVVSIGPGTEDNRRQVLPMLRDAVAIVADVDPDEVAMVGGPLDGATVDAESIRSIRTFSPIASLLAAVLCLFCLRSFILTAVIVAVAVIGQGMVLAMVYYTGRDMNAVLIVLPPLVFVLTISAGIHLANYFLDIVKEFPDLPSPLAARSAMRAGTWPCVLAAGTTIVGLSSLLLVQLDPVRVFGLVASIGVAGTLTMLICILPGAMLKVRRSTALATRTTIDPESSDTKSRSIAAHSRRSDSIKQRFHRWTRRRLTQPWPVILAFAAITITAALGLGRLKSSVNVPRMFLPDSDIRRQYAWFETNVGPTATADVVLKYDERGEETLDRLRDVMRVHAALADVPGVGGVLSAPTFVPPLPRTSRLSDAARRNVIRGLLEDPESSVGRLGYISWENDASQWRITLRMPQSEDANFAPRIAAIRETAESIAAELDDGPEVMVTGHVVIVEASQAILLRDLFRSFVAAFFIIAIVMMVMLRSFVGGLLAMLPNLFPTLVLFGSMGWLDQPLDIGSVMSASVALGIAVDDTVHLLSRFASRRARGLGQIRAAHGALQQCGLAMLHTTLVCGVSLMAYYFSDFVPTSRFALLMFGLLNSALLGVLFLLPAMMASTLGGFLARTIGADPKATVYADDDGTTEMPSDTRRLEPATR